MGKNQVRFVLSSAFLLGLSLSYGSSVYAAKPIDLSQQNMTVLQSFISSPTAGGIKNAINIEEIKRSVDLNQTLHVRIQETYAGYPVWGADAIIHIPQGAKTKASLASVLQAAKNNGTMNGTFYQDLNADLANTPSNIFGETQAQKALQHAIDDFQHNMGKKSEIKDQESKLIVYIDKNNKAHWAYKVSFYAELANEPAKPIYIMDAVSFKVYEQWNNIQTLENVTLDNALGGGFGGNIKMGQLIYDGLSDHLPKLNVQWEPELNTCYWQNADVIVKSYTTKTVMTFACSQSSDHDNVYWIGDIDAINDGYSPSDDALFGGNVIKDMYSKWYGIPVLTNPDGTPMVLNMVVHRLNYDNAYWNGKEMTFGDGYHTFYPLTSLGVASHEISHGFTEQHSALVYSGKSGGMNEAFSDMAAQAAEDYAYKKNSWQIGPEIYKEENKALRYMDQPSKDCYGKTPGDHCSIDNASQYYDGLDVHYSSGVYNRAFFLLGTSSGWTVRKAFDVMVEANRHYWTASSTFDEGACGAVKAARSLHYDVKAVRNAFKTVGVNVKILC